MEEIIYLEYCPNPGYLSLDLQELIIFCKNALHETATLERSDLPESNTKKQCTTGVEGEAMTTRRKSSRAKFNQNSSSSVSENVTKVSMENKIGNELFSSI